HHDLRLDRAVFQGTHNGVLHVHLRASKRADGTRIGDRDVAVDVDALVRNGNEIARPHAAFGRNEQASGSSFEDGYAKDIPDAECDVARAPIVLECADQAQQVFGLDLDDFRGDLDDRVV